MKNKVFKSLIVFVNVIIAVVAFAFTAGATSETENETFTVNGVEIPMFDFVTKPYLNDEDTGLPLTEIRQAFNQKLEVKYENGKYMIKDVGASEAEIYNNRDYEYIELTLEGGYWVLEMTEEDYNNPELDWNVYFIGKNDFWSFYYNDGEPERRVQFNDFYNYYSIGVYVHENEDWLDVSYPALDRICNDMYKNGKLISHEVTHYYEDQDDWFGVTYNPDKTIHHVKIWHALDGTYYYLIPEYGWYSISEVYNDYKVSTPIGYDDKDISYFTNIAPCTINCTHDTVIPATCNDPEICNVCGVIPEGSKPLEHDMSDATCSSPSTCKNGCGHTEGSELGHIDDDFDHVCDRDCGEIAGVCEDQNLNHKCDYGCTKVFGVHEDSNKDHICDYGCDKNIGVCEDNNKDHACDYGCEKTFGTHEDNNNDHVCIYGCGKAVGVCEDQNHDHKCDYGCTKSFGEHIDSEDEDLVCDYGCGATFPQKGIGTIPVIFITIGSTLALEVGIFSIFWFVIKKKKFSDIFK